MSDKDQNPSADLVELRKRHQLYEGEFFGGCDACAEPYPCLVIRIVDNLLQSGLDQALNLSRVDEKRDLEELRERLAGAKAGLSDVRFRHPQWADVEALLARVAEHERQWAIQSEEVTSGVIQHVEFLRQHEADATALARVDELEAQVDVCHTLHGHSIGEIAYLERQNEAAVAALAVFTELLKMLWSKVEDGPPCYEVAETLEHYIGNVVRLSDDERHDALDALLHIPAVVQEHLAQDAALVRLANAAGGILTFLQSSTWEEGELSQKFIQALSAPEVQAALRTEARP